MFISKEQKEKIEFLNNILGTKYRTKSFDLLNPKDLIEATELITAEYVDIDHYWGILSGVNSDFDETLEVFHPANWSNLTFKGTTDDEELDEAIHSLNNAEDAMYALKDRAEEKCKWVWQLILNSDVIEVKKHFFGKNIDVEKAKVNYILEEKIFEVCHEIDYNGNVQHSAAEFAKQLLNRLEEQN